MGKEINDDSYPDIWKLFKSGDKEAFAVLYNLHIDALYHYGTKICKDDDAVKDSLQELFLELFLKRDKIDIAPGKLKYWLLLALKRNLIKKLQAGRKIYHVIMETQILTRNTTSNFSLSRGRGMKNSTPKYPLPLISFLPNRRKPYIFASMNPWNTPK
jgi:DNA-directed RNA polymerase specialized sigma24 family protein